MCIKGSRMFLVALWPFVLYHDRHLAHPPRKLTSKSIRSLSRDSRPTLRSSMTYTNTEAAVDANDATREMANHIITMQQEVVSLRASQAAANKEIIYLRRNQDRVVREVSSEFRQLQREVKATRKQLEEVRESERKLKYVLLLTIARHSITDVGPDYLCRRRIRQIEVDNVSASGSWSSSVPPSNSRTPTPSPSPCQLRRLELRRQGAFRGGDINNLPWAELNDVRGFNPHNPRYHWSAELPPMWEGNPPASRKRTRDAPVADSSPSFDQLSARRHQKMESEDDAPPNKRRRTSSEAHIALRTIVPYRGLARSRTSVQDSSVGTRGSRSFLSGVISGVSSVFHS